MRLRNASERDPGTPVRVRDMMPISAADVLPPKALSAALEARRLRRQMLVYVNLADLDRRLGRHEAQKKRQKIVAALRRLGRP